MKRDFYRSKDFMAVHVPNVRRMRAEVTARMSSFRDLWGVDTLAYEEFERLYEKHLYNFFPVPKRFQELYSDD
eukprot:3312988-Alexandrium_andersonii.AAC.1